MAARRRVRTLLVLTGMLVVSVTLGLALGEAAQAQSVGGLFPAQDQGPGQIEYRFPGAVLAKTLEDGVATNSRRVLGLDYCGDAPSVSGRVLMNEASAALFRVDFAQDYPTRKRRETVYEARKPAGQAAWNQPFAVTIPGATGGTFWLTQTRFGGAGSTFTEVELGFSCPPGGIVSPTPTGAAVLSLSAEQPGQVPVGADLTQTLILRNSGDAPADGVRVAVYYVWPVGVEDIAALGSLVGGQVSYAAVDRASTSGGFSCNAMVPDATSEFLRAGYRFVTVLECRGNLAAGASATIAVHLTAPARPDVLTTVATVSAPGVAPGGARCASIADPTRQFVLWLPEGLPDITQSLAGAADCAGGQTVVGADVNLAVTIAGPAAVERGAPLALQVRVANYGSDPAGGVSTEIALPVVLGDVTAAGEGQDCGFTRDDVQITVQCTLPGLAAGATAETALTATAPEEPGRWRVSALAGANEPEVDTLNNAAEYTVVVGGEIDLVVTITGPATIATGETATYDAIVQNVGTLATREATVSFLWLLGAEVMPTFSGPEGGGCQVQGIQAVCTIPPLAPGGSTLASLSFVVTALGGDVIVEATAGDYGATEANLANNSAEVVTVVTGEVVQLPEGEPTIPAQPALGPELTVFNNNNPDGVRNAPTQPTTFTLDIPHLITSVMTYHWNGGRGATPGTITLEGADGALYGPWQAVGTEGQGGAPDVYWTVYPEAVLPAGTYTVIDSDPATWAQNSRSGNAGIATIKGRTLGHQ